MDLQLVTISPAQPPYKAIQYRTPHPNHPEWGHVDRPYVLGSFGAYVSLVSATPRIQHNGLSLNHDRKVKREPRTHIPWQVLCVVRIRRLCSWTRDRARCSHGSRNLGYRYPAYTTTPVPPHQTQATSPRQGVSQWEEKRNRLLVIRVWQAWGLD